MNGPSLLTSKLSILLTVLHAGTADSLQIMQVCILQFNMSIALRLSFWSHSLYVTKPQDDYA